MNKRTMFILLTLALLLCLFPAFASSNEDESERIVDTEPPTVTGITLSATNVTAPGLITITVTATDDISGIDYVSASFRNADTNSYLSADFETYGDGIIIGTIKAGRYTNAGTYTIALLSLSDYADNYITYYGRGSEYYSDDEDKLPEALAGISFVVQDSSSAPPTIKTQPKDVNVTNGEEAIFTVEAEGEGTITYQWFSRPNANADLTLVDGAAKDSYTVTGTKDNNGWQFRCRVKNEGGEVYSNAATLTMTEAAPPTIKTQPKSANVKSGAKAKFTVKVKEKHVTYQWFSKAPGAADWAELPGETKGTLTVVATKANSGTQYRCRVRTAEGGEADTIAATLTVKIQPPVIKTPPKNLAVVSGKKAKFTVKASGPKLTYTWFSRPNAEAAWTPVAGQNKSSLSVVASKANDGSQYYCHIQNTDGEVDSAVVTLTVTPQPPTIKTQPKDAKVKLGAKAKFKVKATGKDVTYQWYYRTSEDGEWILIDGATKATYEVVAKETNIGWQYRCLAKNGDGQAYSDPATLFKK